MYNSNNYGYSPYGRYIPQQPIQQSMPIGNENFATQPVNNSYKLNGMPVDSIDVVKATNIGVSGDTFYFPLTDGSGIVTKQLQMDGTSKIVVYKPITEQKEEVKYITQEDMEKAINGIDFSDLDDIKDDIKELRQDIKDLKKKKVKDE